MSRRSIRVAIVHDFLTQAGGAERVVGVLHEMFPTAPIYTTVLERSSLWPSLSDADFRVTWMQKLPGVTRYYRAYLPCYPAAIRSIDLRRYDLVVSSSSAFAKSVRVSPEALHICYCHTPMRFAWDYDNYVARERFNLAYRALLPPVVRLLRRWDRATAGGPDIYVANSNTVRERIRRCYGRDSTVVHPPVDTARFSLSTPKRDHFIVVSRLVAYKRIDLAVSAFTALGLPLLIVGDGPARRDLEAIAGPTVRFLGRIPDGDASVLLAQARGLIFPGEEDFGIVPLEANAAGTPVVAFGRGGALDSVRPGHSGVLFADQCVDSLIGAVRECDEREWAASDLRRHAECFGADAFRARLLAVVEDGFARKAGAAGLLNSALSGHRMGSVTRAAVVE